MKIMSLVTVSAVLILLVLATARFYVFIESRKPKTARALGLVLFTMAIVLLTMQFILKDFMTLYAVETVLLYLNIVYAVFALSEAHTWYGKLGWVFGFICVCLGFMLESGCLLMWDFRMPL